MNNAIEFYENISVSIEVEDNSSCPVTKELGRRGLYVAATGSALLGIWGLVCLVAGLSNCGDLAAFRETLLMALTGL